MPEGGSMPPEGLDEQNNLAPPEVPEAQQLYFTPEEAAIRMRVSPRTVYRALRSGSLTSHRVGRQYRITPEAINEYVLSHNNRNRKPGTGSALGVLILMALSIATHHLWCHEAHEA